MDRGLDPDITPVGDVMTTDLVVGDPDEDHLDLQDKGEEIGCLREYLYQVPPEPAHPGTRW